jgi:cytochrome P450
VPVYPRNAMMVRRSSFSALWAYFHELIAERRGNPGDDLLSPLKVEQEGDRLTGPDL